MDDRRRQSREVRDWLELLIEHSPLPCMVHHASGQMLSVNEAFTEITGYQLEDVPTAVDWLMKSRRITRAEAHEADEAYGKLFTEPGANLNEENLVVTKDGRRRCWLFHVPRVFETTDGEPICLMMAVDVTDRVESERAAAANQEFIERIFNTCPNVLYVHDLRTNAPVYQNRNVGESIGYTKQEITEMGADILPRLMHPNDLPRAMEHFSNLVQASDGEILQFDYRMRHRDGTWRWFSSMDTPFLRGEDGLVAQILGTAIDITPRIEAEEHRRHLEEQVRQAQKIEAVGRLAGGIAHDLNNLLVPIELSVGLLWESARAEDRRHLEVIRDASRRAAELTRQVLAFSREQLLDIQALDLNEAIESFARMLRRLLGEVIELKLQLSERLPPVFTDRSQLEQVLLNLVVNARDAMPKGGTLTIATRRRFADDADTERVVLEVVDSGIGMDEATRDRAFDPFFTTKGPGKGTGLGLATVQGIVEQHGGNVVLHSSPGKGTRVEIELPVAPPGSEARLANEHDAHVEVGDERIVVAEDDPRVRALVVETLARAGYDAVEAATPKAALELVESADRLDLLITDVIMPGMNGVELRRAALRARPGLRVLLMSGYTDEHLASSGALNERYHLLVKPFSVQDLLRKVRDVLSDDGAASVRRD